MIPEHASQTGSFFFGRACAAQRLLRSHVARNASSSALPEHVRMHSTVESVSKWMAIKIRLLGSGWRSRQSCAALWIASASVKHAQHACMPMPLPVPGGPHRMMAIKTSAPKTADLASGTQELVFGPPLSSAFYCSLPGPNEAAYSPSSCPTYSSSVRGRMRAARGASVFILSCLAWEKRSILIFRGMPASHYPTFSSGNNYLSVHPKGDNCSPTSIGQTFNPRSIWTPVKVIRPGLISGMKQMNFFTGQRIFSFSLIRFKLVA